MSEVEKPTPEGETATEAEPVHGFSPNAIQAVAAARALETLAKEGNTDAVHALLNAFWNPVQEFIGDSPLKMLHAAGLVDDLKYTRITAGLAVLGAYIVYEGNFEKMRERMERVTKGVHKAPPEAVEDAVNTIYMDALAQARIAGPKRAATPWMTDAEIDALDADLKSAA